MTTKQLIEILSKLNPEDHIMIGDEDEQGLLFNIHSLAEAVTEDGNKVFVLQQDFNNTTNLG